jgi:hypothetical protein
VNFFLPLLSLLIQPEFESTDALSQSGFKAASNFVGSGNPNSNLARRYLI